MKAVFENTNELSSLALETVKHLRSRIGVDMAFVFVLRAGSNETGMALDGGAVPIDTAFVQVVTGLLELRAAVVKAAE
jgi:hypothetical protein